ncbi:MAG: YidC/Oxa1 family membrane protein insertase [Clostridia bacterium]|nr:YidC/Oxa1 family membrane protein insertase [Clostridia bacterium]
MSFFAILESLLIGPLKLIFEIIFELANRFVNHPGLSIIFLSLVMNILVLPLYKRADAMQEEARDKDMLLSRGVSHIKKTFKGDEKMMILQAYYRQNNYKPTDALNGSVSLLLEIPFFMAAYQFLSHLEVLQGVSLGPIADLSKPDGLLVIGGFAINLLPILMTLINCISSALYLKGFPLKTKIQLYGMAAFFLVFLYTSPAGLVFYWTLNNAFSLVKTIFYKIKNPAKVIKILTAIIGTAAIIFAVFFFNTPHLKRKLFIIFIGLVLWLPALITILKSKVDIKIKAFDAEPNRKLFIAGSLFLTVLVGLRIPFSFISASPQEYVDITYFHNPIWFGVNALCLAIGTFMIWLRVFYWLANKKGKVIFERLIAILCAVFLVNYMFFGTKLGNMSPSLQFENDVFFRVSEQLINLLVIGIVAVGMYFVAKKWGKKLTAIVLVATLAFSVMSVIDLNTTRNSVNSIANVQNMEKPSFTLSTKGKNVVVIMLDRAMGTHIPYIMQEMPELKEKYDGFVYYSNTISFGGHTNFGAPPIFGGYEYTPVEMNKRDEEYLYEKHNEAALVMPTLFSQNGFDVTVCDIPYINYDWISDPAFFNSVPNTSSYRTEGYFGNNQVKQRTIDNNKRNFFCLSLMKTMPLFMQPTIYHKGTYNQSISPVDEISYSIQTTNGISKAQGLSNDFMEKYHVLDNMTTMTEITNTEKNTFLAFVNNMTHEPTLLQAPEYEVSFNVDNTEYDAQHPDRFVVDGKEIKVDTEHIMKHYHTNILALKELAEWFDYLRENGVYDNTKIIITSDHGYTLENFDELIFDKDDQHKNVNLYAPLLLVKDFNAHGFETSDEFMTNADVPTLATSGVIENPVNPFTNKPINSDEKTAHDQIITMSDKFDTYENNGYTFMPSGWISVKDNLWDRNNWKFYDEQVVLKEHALPQ